MSGRLRGVLPDNMTPEQRALYDRYATGVRAERTSELALVDEKTGELLGPPGLWVHQPRLGSVLEQLGAVVRFELSIPRAAAEMVILSVAHHWNCEFERHAHERAALVAGVTADQVASISSGAPPAGVDHVEGALLGAARELLGLGGLTGDGYRDARRAVGEVGVLELTTLVGYYTMLAFQLRAFDVTVASAGETGT